MFESVDDVIQQLGEHDYIADKNIGTVVYLAARLEKPVLVEGPAGVGKTELAKVVAAALGRPLVRLQCYEGLDEAKALYEWEYSKQLLYTQILKEKLAEVMAGAGTLRDAADRVGQEDSVFFSDRCVVPRPLLHAITAEDPTALLIDDLSTSSISSRQGSSAVMAWSRGRGTMKRREKKTLSSAPTRSAASRRLVAPAMVSESFSLRIWV